MRGEEATVGKPTGFFTNAGLRINCQTMFFIKSALEALEKPDKPFIHNVIPAGRSR